MFLSVITE